jgi:VWFA-related protein
MRCAWAVVLGCLVAVLVPSASDAAVNLRVEARPVTDPIKVYVTVTDSDGHPVSNLTAADFAVLVDGAVVPTPSFSQPPSQDPTQRVSVVFVMDYSGSVVEVALDALQQSVLNFIAAMQPGDYAAIVKFNAQNPSKASVVQPFTEIDGAAGSSALVSAVMAPYPGGTSGGNEANLFDGVKLAADQFSSQGAALPKGPKAIVVASDGEENASTGSGTSAVDLSNQLGVSIFTVGVGVVKEGTPLQIMQEFASRTGGQYLPAPTDAQIGDAYASISRLLNNEYVLTFPSSISDSSTHTVEVRVVGQTAPARATFTRSAATNPPATDKDSGGGGGSTGLLEILAGAALLALRRRRRT